VFFLSNNSISGYILRGLYDKHVKLGCEKKTHYNFAMGFVNK
jgi:hypothetical protein